MISNYRFLGVIANSRSVNVFACCLAVSVAGYWTTMSITSSDSQIDLWIYTSGAQLALAGESPYDLNRIHARVAERWPDNELLISNSGFFLPPQALLSYAPLAVLPWQSAKWVWCCGTLALAVVTAWSFGELTKNRMGGWGLAIAVLALLVNPHTLFGLCLGQSTLFVLGCVVLGEVLERKGWRRAGRFLWAMAFLKPHIALPLVPLAWWFGGWRRATEVLGWVVVLNVLAGIVFFGKPLFVFEYLRTVSNAHHSVLFNRVDQNPLLTGWNTVLVSSGGPAIELGMAGTLVGYLALSAAITARLYVWRPRPTWEWGFAVVGCGMVTCCQLPPYELPLLTLGLPYVIGLLHSSHSSVSRLAGIGILATGLFASLPGWDIIAYHQWVEQCFGSKSTPPGAILAAHPSVGALLMTVGVLVLGPRPVQLAATSGLSALTSVSRSLLRSSTNTTTG